ncbi:hypothetical protein [Deinococcus aquiradiocola]|uniref:Uncharacterized protein n=1 Tax=Deinococcus aquiradiocola TaxID=393059 RepID=A0A917PFU2_9DEIO|nr:hypothetical protein [Deinococcus aquiradiocola]GGJ75386.1 hypothetical protein GCM10008939_19550 [Deinococcus aquiradiocola]
MREQIKRILGLVVAGRLTPADASALLAALHPGLALSDGAAEHLFGLLSSEDFGPDRVTNMLMVRVAEHGAPPPPPPPRPGATFRIGGESYPLDDLGETIGARVEEALGGLLGRKARAPQPGTILRIETEDENGGSFNANLPLSLAMHAERLIPPHALGALERSGLSIDALKLLLQANPPTGPLLEAEDEHGNRVQLSIR